MIPSDLAARLRMITEASFFDSEPPVQGVAKVRELQARLPQLLPGQPFTATIQRPLPDGTFQAIVAGREYTLALNHAAKSGDTLELIATRNGPNAVFAQLANTQAGAGAEAQLRPSLSPTGQLISFLLTGQPVSKPVQLAGGQPLLNAAALAAADTAMAKGAAQTSNLSAPASALFAPVLRQALAQSGLFYESHQLQWLSGKLDRAALMREPQGQHAPPRPGGAPSGQPGATSTTSTAGAGGLAQAGLARMGANMAAITGLNEATETDGRSARLSDVLRDAVQMRQPVIPERLMPILHQQLDAMATQQYQLYGQAWAGQAFEWDIEDQHSGNREGQEGSDEWNSTLRLTMPRLGSVEAHLRLSPAGIALRLIADDDETVAALGGAQAALESALEAAGLSLTGFVTEKRRDE